MADFELVMPKMGESIMEATILKWLKEEGDRIDIDETILEIATDKVDSEIPSPVEGTLTSILHREDAVVKVGDIIATIATTAEPSESSPRSNGKPQKAAPVEAPIVEAEAVIDAKIEQPSSTAPAPVSDPTRFYSPLVKNIARQENISTEELALIPGSGLNNRVTKRDILMYVENRLVSSTSSEHISPPGFMQQSETPTGEPAQVTPINVSAGSGDELIVMDRMRKMIAKHMVDSKQTSPHVTSFVEADVTNLVDWRERNKVAFQDLYGAKLTFTPIFIQAVARAILDFPKINISVQGDHIIVKKKINIGMATALPSGNLIVPVIHNADSYSLSGLAKVVNDLSDRARSNDLKPNDVQDGTFTLTNVGTFGNVMGTPIINQPQVAILATGAIRKKPAVVETEYGDLIAVRQMVFLSLSYDHRVVDGFLGGSFLRKVADYLEQFAHDEIS